MYFWELWRTVEQQRAIGRLVNGEAPAPEDNPSIQEHKIIEFQEFHMYLGATGKIIVYKFAIFPQKCYT